MICAIPSAGRSGEVITTRLFPKDKTFICVPESEMNEYRKHHDDSMLVAHPDSVYGLGEKRQWMLDNIPCDDRIVFMADDDLVKFQWLGGHEGYTGGIKRTLHDPNHVWEVILNTAHICRDLGTSMFGFGEYADIRKFNYPSPFSTRGRINGFSMGIINDGQVRFDPRLVVKQDFDFFLMTLYWKRFIWRDDRYAFVAKHYTNSGGLAAHRSIDMETRCIRIVQEKFGEHIVQQDKKMPWKVHVFTSRRNVAK